ncbi:MAG: hypothetical protein V1799_21900 [bacterium]
MKPIWFFVGILLMILGVLIFVTGIILYISPPERQPVLGELHPDIWWGALMTIAGTIFLLANRKKTVA